MNINKNKNNNKNEKFNPIIFLMSLGAGGLSIGFWIFLNYGLSHGKGLVTSTQVHNLANTLFQKIIFTSMEIMAIIFAIIHFVTLFYFLKQYFSWRKTNDYKNYMENPLINNGIMAMFLAIDMAFNIAFSIGNHFIIQNGSWFQTIMGPALIGWGILYIITMIFSLKILKTAFTKDFNINKIHFGFMVHPFALAMLAVTGNGIAAFSKTVWIANIAFFMALMPLMVAILLTIVKVVTMFQHHFKNNLPDRNFLPSTFIIMPTLMLIFLSFFRMGHYFEHIFNLEIETTYYIFSSIIPFAFLTWYGIFGLILIKDYFKNFKEFNVTQWGFICPLVAYVVIGSIVNKVWLNVWIPMSMFLTLTVIFTSILFFKLTYRQIKFNNIDK